MATQTRRRPEAQRTAKDPNKGWIAFAGIYLGLAGLFNLIWGLTALANKEYFVEDGLVWSSLQTWGWIAVLVAAAQIVTGIMVFSRRMGGLILALVLAMCGMLVSFLTIGAYPIWSAVAIVCNALVLWAVTVHGDQSV
jgi:hypothetical protein